MPMSPRLLKPIAGRSGGFDPDAQAYISAVETADAQPLELAVKTAVNNFVLGCKADGIWSAIEASCILMGARTLSGALTPLVGAAPTNNGPFVSGDYNRKTGLVGNGSTKFLSANRNNNADPQNSQHLSLYASTAEAAAVRYMGDGNATGSSTLGTSLGTNFGFRSRTSSITATAAGVANGFYGKSRTSSSSVSWRTVGQSGTATVNSETSSTGVIEVFRAAIAGTSSRFAFYSIGESLDLALLESRVNALYTAIGAAIP